MNPSALVAAKKQLRSLMKEKLANIPPESLTQQSATIFGQLSQFRPYVEATKVAVYLSMQTGEVQTDLIVRHALVSGKQVFVPYLHKSELASGEGPARLMDMVSLRSVGDYETLQKDKWGIPSVDPATIGERQRSVGELHGQPLDDVALDLILMPGVAFDVDPQSGVLRRLGHGKGFYDYFLHRYAMAESARKRPRVLLYALALREQFLLSASSESVPVGPHDQPLDGLILGDGRIIQSPEH